MVLHNLTYTSKEYVYVYLAHRETPFKIFKNFHKQEHFREFYDSELGLVKNHRIPDPKNYLILAANYSGGRIHSISPPLIQIKLYKDNDNCLLLITDKDYKPIGTVDISKKTTSNPIISSKRYGNIVETSSKVPCYIVLSSSIDSNDNNKIIQKHFGSGNIFTIPNMYKDTNVFIHFYLNDNTFIGTRTLYPNAKKTYAKPSVPYISYNSTTHCVAVTWTSITKYNMYSILRRRISDGYTPWVTVGSLIDNPPAFDCGIDTNHDGHFEYRIVGHKDGLYIIGDSEKITLPSKEVMMNKPHVRATSNTEGSMKWRAPTVINC